MGSTPAIPGAFSHAQAHLAREESSRYSDAAALRPSRPSKTNQTAQAM